MDENLINKLMEIEPKQAIIQKKGRNQEFVMDSSSLIQAGKLISIRPHARFQDFPAHRHNYVELVYMASGSTTHIINETHPLVLKEGELLFMNQHVTHSIKKAGERDIAANFIVLPAFFDIALDMIGTDNVLSQFLLGSLQKSASDVSYLHFAVADVLPVQNLVESMIWGILNEQPNNRRISQVSMALLFLQLLNYTQRLVISSGNNNSALVIEALREIEENYQNANFTSLAKKYNVSVAYLSRLLKQKTGHTFKELLKQKRLSKSEQMLIQTRLSVTEIISAVGYENTSYFHRIFMEKNSCTPREFREKAIK